MKYQCNLCSKIYDRERDANDCHPDVIKIPEDDAERRVRSLIDKVAGIKTEIQASRVGETKGA